MEALGAHGTARGTEVVGTAQLAVMIRRRQQVIVRRSSGNSRCVTCVRLT